MSKDVNGVDPLEYMTQDELNVLENMSYSVETLNQDEMIQLLIDKDMETYALNEGIDKDNDYTESERRLTEEENEAEAERLDRVDKMITDICNIGEEWELILAIQTFLDKLTDIPYSDYNAINSKVDNIYWENNYEHFGNIGTEGTTLKKLFGQTENARGKYSDQYKRVSKVTTVKKYVQPEFIEMDLEKLPIDYKVEMSPLATAKLFIMMKYYQDIEWGAYMKLDRALPKLEDMYKKEECTITILDLVLIPQIRSSAHVEYLETELPEFMHEWRQAKLDGFYVNAGRIHSHHTMGSWHSKTDTGEFIKAYETEDRMLSIVTAFNDKTKKLDQTKDLNDWDYFFKALDYDTVTFLPLVGDQKNQVKADYGYQIRSTIYLNKYGQGELNEAIAWRDQFEQMDKFVEHKYPLIQKLLRLQEVKKIDEIDLYTLRKQIIDDPHMFNFVSDMINLLGETKVEANSNLKYKSRLTEIQKIIERK
jgi:hypothetical protein